MNDKKPADLVQRILAMAQKREKQATMVSGGRAADLLKAAESYRKLAKAVAHK